MKRVVKMNKKLRTIMLFIFAFITIFVFSDNILALKWDDGNDYIYLKTTEENYSSRSDLLDELLDSPEFE